MPDNEIQKNVGAVRDEKKIYSSPELREYGNVAELTKGSGLLFLDILIQGSATIVATII
jgi:hypothetical protein